VGVDLNIRATERGRLNDRHDADRNSDKCTSTLYADGYAADAQ
jgi:hypothetical protein